MLRHFRVLRQAATNHSPVLLPLVSILTQGWLGKMLLSSVGFDDTNGDAEVGCCSVCPPRVCIFFRSASEYVSSCAHELVLYMLDRVIDFKEPTCRKNSLSLQVGRPELTAMIILFNHGATSY